MSPLARLSPSSLTYPPPDAGLYVVRPPVSPPRKVRALTDILLEYFGAGQSRAAPKLLPNHSPSWWHYRRVRRYRIRRLSGPRGLAKGMASRLLIVPK